MDGLDESEAVARLDEIIKHNGVYKVSEEEQKKIGFGSSHSSPHRIYELTKSRAYDEEDDDYDD